LAPQVGLEPTTLRLTVARKPIYASYCWYLWASLNPVLMRLFPALPLLLSTTDLC